MSSFYNNGDSALAQTVRLNVRHSEVGFVVLTLITVIVL